MLYTHHLKIRPFLEVPNSSMQNTWEALPGDLSIHFKSVPQVPNSYNRWGPKWLHVSIRQEIHMRKVQTITLNPKLLNFKLLSNFMKSLKKKKSMIPKYSWVNSVSGKINRVSHLGGYKAPQAGSLPAEPPHNREALGSLALQEVGEQGIGRHLNVQGAWLPALGQRRCGWHPETLTSWRRKVTAFSQH